MTQLCIKLKNGTEIKDFFKDYKLEKDCILTDDGIETKKYPYEDIYIAAVREPDEQTSTAWMWLFESEQHRNEVVPFGF